MNFNAACKVAFAGFLRCREFTYLAFDYKDRYTFMNTKLTRNDVSFSEDNTYAILRLKRSKADVEHHSVDIILSTTNNQCCPVTALKNLFTCDPQPPTAPLFQLDGGLCDSTTFIALLRERLHDIGDPRTDYYSGHSFRQGAAQHAADYGITHYDIQRLGRWSSKAFKLYFHESHANLYSLNKRFLTGTALALH